MQTRFISKLQIPANFYFNFLGQSLASPTVLGNSEITSNFPEGYFHGITGLQANLFTDAQKTAFEVIILKATD
jgi:hypothetical protein